jgi:hypothetical protein
MKINLNYNNFNKYIDINISDKLGYILENLLNNCSLLIYNIENAQIITDNEYYLFGEEEAPFNITFEQFLININKNEEYIKKIIINDRKRDNNGNVFKENKTIDNYNKWFQYNENENFLNYMNYTPNENSHIIRYPIDSLLDNILNISLPLNNDDDIVNYDNNEENEQSEDNLNSLTLNYEIEETREETNNEERDNISNNFIGEDLSDIYAPPPIIETPLNQFNNLIDIIDNYIRNTEHLFINEVIPTLDNFNNIILNEDVKIILNDDEFNNLEKIQYDTKSNKCVECLICLDNFEENETLIKIKCNHIFHCNCIKNWLCEESNKCPVCRIEIGDLNNKKMI